MSFNDDAFASTATLIMSDFNNLTEFDDFHKDLFLGNAMERIAEESLLEELDCKHHLKLMSDANDAFDASFSTSIDHDMNSIETHGAPFTLFGDEETVGSLDFMNTRSRFDSPTVPDDVDMKSMGLTHPIHNPLVGSTIQDGLSPQTASIAANELELTPMDPMKTLCTLVSPPLMRAESLETSSEESPSSMASLSPLAKAVVGRSKVKVEVPSVCSPDMVMTSSTQMRSSGCFSPSTTAFSKSEGGSLFNMVLRRGEGCTSIPQLKRDLVQSVSVNATENSTLGNIFGSLGQLSLVPSIQRSQSSHALGQLRMPGHCLGVCVNDGRTQPMSKQEVPLSSPSGFNLLSPYQSFNSQGLCERPAGSIAPIRRVYSTGDLQGFNGMQSFYGIKAENAIPEEAAHNITEERKMKLHRYRQKRTERNFSKKVKYACRKTLAENRPRVRGRFARNDEMGDLGIRSNSDLPSIDEYEVAFRSHRPRMVRDQQVYFVANNSCIMSSTPITQFWNSVGMKVAM